MTDSIKYKRVSPTPEEVTEHVRKHGGRPRTYRYECKDCGKRIWGSGLGVGSHTRACDKKLYAARIAARTVGTVTEDGAVSIDDDAIKTLAAEAWTNHPNNPERSPGITITDYSTGELPAEEDLQWDTEALRRNFEVLGFSAPFVVVRRRSDGVKGILQFNHNPRVYFGWLADD